MSLTAFATLLERLAFTPQRLGKERGHRGQHQGG